MNGTLIVGGDLNANRGNPTYWPTDTSKIPDQFNFFIPRQVSPNFKELEENFDKDSERHHHSAQKRRNRF